MAVVSTKDYVGVPRDRVENFNGNRIVYVSWDQHLLFAASFMTCLSPDTLFRDWVQNNVVPLMAPDPDAANVDWSSVTWIKGGEAFRPDWDASLADNGIGHKAHLRFQTPGLNSICQ